MFLSRDRSLTLKYIASLVVLARVCDSLPTLEKLSNVYDDLRYSHGHEFGKASENTVIFCIQGFLDTLIMESTSCVACLLVYLHHNFISSNLDICHMCGIERHICCYHIFCSSMINKCCSFLILMNVCSCMGPKGRLHLKCSGTYLCNVAGIYVQKHMPMLSVCIPVFVVSFAIMVSSYEVYILI